MSQLNEFEIKIKSDKNIDIIFESIKQYCDDTYELIGNEKSVNLLMSIGNNSKILKNVIKKTLYNDKCEKINDNDVFYIKQRIASRYVSDAYEHNNIPVNLNLTFSTEQIIRYYEISNGFYRIKDRLSYKISDEWRIDLTLVKNVTDFKELNLLITLFFKKFDVKNFMNRKNHIDSYEIEIEYTGKEHIDLEIIKDKLDYLLSFINVYKNQLRELNYLLTDSYSNTKLTFQNIVNQAITLDKYKYYGNIYKFDNYLITEKLDGERMLLFIMYTNIYLIYGNKKIQRKTNVNNTNIIIALDCEYFMNEDDIDDIYIFDVLYYDDTKVHKLGYVERLKYFEKCKKITDDIDEYNIIYKEFEQINNTSKDSNIETLVHKYYTNKIKNSKYNIDGIIFSEPLNNYYNTHNYKWKPVEYNSIDFYAIKYDQHNMNGDITYLYKLYVKVNINYIKKINIDKRNIINIENEQYTFHLLFTPSIQQNDYVFESKRNDLDNKIIELKKNLSTWKWELLRVRDDKKTANHLYTAEQIYMNYYNPLELEMLYNSSDINIHYFKTNEKNDVIISYLKWNNKVKFEMYETYLKNINILLDLGAGRGADINKYSIYNIKNVIMTDNDIMALHEVIVDRKQTTSKSSNIKYLPNIYTIKLDLTDNYLDLYRVINNKTAFNKVDAIMISLAIHYFAFTDSLLENLINLIDTMLTSKGIVIISLLNGKKVFDLLKKNNGEWKVSPNKYHIEFTNKQTKYNKFNKYIDINIQLPFSQNELYTEKLLDIDYIIRIFKNHKMIVRDSRSFIDFDIKDVILNDDDKQYVELYHMILFQKKN